MFNKKLLRCFFIFVSSFFVVGVSNAQVEYLVNGYEEKFFNNDEGPGAEVKSIERDGSNSQYIYEVPTIKALAHMYWAVGLYKLSDNYNVDEFLRVNECDLFTKFSSDELEWSEVRSATKIFIKNNKSDFPTRFIFTMPLKLADYNPRRQSFEIQDMYKIKTSRRFELYASDFGAKACSDDYPKSKGYPRILFLEFSRPFNLVSIPMSSKQAIFYIKKTMMEYHNSYAPRLRNKEVMYAYRKVFLTLKVKIFASGGLKGINNYGIPIVKMLGILESYAVYADKELTNLLFEQSYVSNKQKGKLDVKLKEQYEVLRIRSKNGGILSY